MSPAPTTTHPRRMWQRLDQAADGIAVDVCLYVCSAAFAAITAATSTLIPHRAWGAVAVAGYLAAGLIAGGQLLARRRGIRPRWYGPAARAVLVVLTWLSTAVLPMILQAIQRVDGCTDRAQEEVLVIEQAGRRLLHDGTPYLGREAIAALPGGEQLLAYTPYQPGMALFGLPRAAGGVAWWTDARLWFALVTAAAIAAALVSLRRPGHTDTITRDAALVRAVQAIAVLPICALTLATGGDDLPVLALCLLALALAAGDRFFATGVAVGAAAAMKLFAWPVAVVLFIGGLARNWRRAVRFGVAAISFPIAALVPAYLVDGAAMIENVLRFPLGRGLVGSPAASPLPGHLIAQAFPAGWGIAIALLAASGVAIAVQLVRRPPGTAAQIALVCGYGLLVAILLMPATRFGYLLYPVAFFVWAPALRIAAATSDPRVDRAELIPVP